MSLISGFKDKKQDEQLISNYKRNLQQQIINNEKRGIANAEYFHNQRLGITPMAPQSKTADEELKDMALQNELAETNLKSIMKDADAVAVLAKLQHDNEVQDFNSYFGKFKKEIEGTTFIYPAFFNALLERFKEKLARTDHTGIHIPLDSEDLQNALGSEFDVLIEAINENFPDIRKKDIDTILNLYQDFITTLSNHSIKSIRFS